MWRILTVWTCWLLLAQPRYRSSALPAPTGSPAPTQGLLRAKAGGERVRRAATEENYWAYSGTHGPGEGWASAYPECRERNQSPINIMDQDAKVSTDYQELTLEGFDTESSNKTSMKNTGKTVAIMLKDDYFVQGAGLPGRFKAEKVEFHWGPSNGSDGSEHSINGRRYPVEMQVYMYNADDFDSLSAALRERRIIAAMAVFLQVGGKDNPAVDHIIHGLKGVVHHDKETLLEPFVLKDLLPSSLGSYYRYTGSLTTPPCSKVVEWIIFSRPIYVSYKQLEAFYSIFTTEQQDHVKSVEYLRSNFRPIQSLDNRPLYKSAVRNAWMPDLTGSANWPDGTEASKVCSSAPINMKVQHLNGSALLVRWAHPELTYHPPILHFLVSYSWTAHDDSYEETHLTDDRHRTEAVISPVSPDVLYLFRVQAVCMNDMRSDFSQSMLFRANTTRIFEGTRIVKTGMPTISPASSADMAPISSGSSTWASSGIPFSFVSMATGIGPSSSGSQATVASVVTSTLLAGLGFSGGIISSFPSSIWPSRAPTHKLNSPCQTPGPSRNGPATTAPAKQNSQAANKHGHGSQSQVEARKKEEDEEEEEEEKDEKKEKKRSGGAAKTGRNYRSTESQYTTDTPHSGARERGKTDPDPTEPQAATDNQLGLCTFHPLHPTATTGRADETGPSSVAKETNKALKTLKFWASSVNLDRPNSVGCTLDGWRGWGDWLVPLLGVSGLAFLCLVLLLALLLYWRRCFQSSHFHVEHSCSLRVVPNGTSPVIPGQDNIEAMPVYQFTKHFSKLHPNSQQRFSEGFEEIQRYRVTERSQHSNSKHKNRFINGGTYDHSRVRLRLLAGKDSKRCNVVNAHHVDAFKKSKAYIVTKGPLKSTFEDSWRIVLEQNTGVIFMLTNLVEKGWAWAQRTAVQDHHTQRAEEGDPEAPPRSSDPQTLHMGTRFYHCSAGRTETHSASASVLRQVKDLSTVSVLGFLKYMCTQRNDLVQTELVTQCNARRIECFNAQKESNKERESHSSMVPAERARVRFTPSPAIKGWDYINAAAIPDYHQRLQLIITQRPAAHAAHHFRRTIWDHNAQLRLMLPEPHRVDQQDDYLLEVLQFQCPAWPNRDAPISRPFQLISVIREDPAMRDGLTVLHDELREDSAGTTCALETSAQRPETGIYQVVQMINLMTRGVFTNVGQNQYLHRTLLSPLGCEEASSAPLSEDWSGAMASCTISPHPCSPVLQ